MENIIKVTTNEQGYNVVSARELYSFLEVKTPFRLWVERMFEYGFEENKDYTPYFFVHPQNKIKNNIVKMYLIIVFLF